MWISVTASITTVERQRAEELAHDDLEVGERRGQQQLDRARPLLLRVRPHRDHRHAGTGRRIVTFCSSGRIICWLTFIDCGPACRTGPSACSGGRSSARMRDEEVAVEQREEADHDVGDRRREVRPQLLVRDREDVTHWPSPLRRPPASAVLRSSATGRSLRGSCASAAARAAPSRSRRRRARDRGGRRGRCSLSTS